MLAKSIITAITYAKKKTCQRSKILFLFKPENDGTKQRAPFLRNLPSVQTFCGSSDIVTPTLPVKIVFLQFGSGKQPKCPSLDAWIKKPDVT